MTPPTVISISGPDGAGKSTQANRIMEVLENDGVECEYRWFGAQHLFSLPLLLYARVVGLSEVQQLPSGRKVGYHYFWRSKLVSSLYPVLLLLDTYLFYVIRIYLPRALSGKTIVCDRFVIDIIVRIMLSTGDRDFYRSSLGKAFLWLVSDETFIILLTADSETLRSRRDDVREDETLGQMIDCYNAVATYLDLERVDAGNSPDLIHQKILSSLE